MGYDCPSPALVLKSVSMERSTVPLAPLGPLGLVAVSDCLRGSRVRWDGGHNGHTWPRHAAERLFTLVGLCPEVGIGMGAPRPPIQLTGDAARPRALAVSDSTLDYTAALSDYARRSAATLDEVAGYIFADRSPSCGLADVKVFGADGGFRRVGRGVYAAAVAAAYPTLPVVDAQTLADHETFVDFASAVAARAGNRAPRRRVAAMLDGLRRHPASRKRFGASANQERRGKSMR